MAFLEQFSSDEKELIISLPYRAGVWVSNADGSGGSAADFKEQEALAEIIKRKASGMFESAFVHEVMADLYQRQSDWESWAEDTGDVSGDCRKAMGIIAGKLGARDLDAYKQNIMTIAIEVAKAFREFDVNETFFVKLWTWIRLAIDKLIGKVKGEVYESESLLNISYEEDLALAELSQALSTGPQRDSMLG